MAIRDDEFLELYNKHKETGIGFKGRLADELNVVNSTVSAKINRLKANGMIPLDSGNSVGQGEILKGTSTLYKTDAETGNT